eukprot:gnl/Spiro4/8420_TR4422_c0_g1_i1.p1 gnl/Spiro4/8420_TR4422_c0_g1~~gnl/Spiro4/8420_TR4422_c0_g1_i1.p1  ORF type:complete len:349 (-),score=96.15 gnl/Spiro4/8420_TR4422_c0_g1_i1:90-1109(-)
MDGDDDEVRRRRKVREEAQRRAKQQARRRDLPTSNTAMPKSSNERRAAPSAGAAPPAKQPENTDGDEELARRLYAELNMGADPVGVSRSDSDRSWVDLNRDLIEEEEHRARELELSEKAARELQEQFYAESDDMHHAEHEHDVGEHDEDEMRRHWAHQMARFQLEGHQPRNPLEGILAMFAPMLMPHSASALPAGARAIRFADPDELRMHFANLGGGEDEVDIGDYAANIRLAERLGQARERGARPEQIAALPTHTYHSPAPPAGGASSSSSNASSSNNNNNNKNNDSSNRTCVVCQEDFEDGATVKVLPCLHSFHAECIDPWIAINATCPTCKASVKQ